MKIKQSKARELFEAWWSIHGDGKSEAIAWEAFKKGVKVAEAYCRAEK